MTIYQKLINAGIKISHHCSDLYCQVNPISKNILSTYEYKNLVMTFTSNIDGTLWYDIPFGYDPYWDKRFN